MQLLQLLLLFLRISGMLQLMMRTVVVEEVVGVVLLLLVLRLTSAQILNGMDEKMEHKNRFKKNGKRKIEVCRYSMLTYRCGLRRDLLIRINGQCRGNSSRPVRCNAN